jgi:hypothetical protein
MACRMRGHNDGQARQIFGDLIDMPADIAITDNEITVAILAPRPSFVVERPVPPAHRVGHAKSSGSIPIRGDPGWWRALIVRAAMLRMRIGCSSRRIVLHRPQLGLTYNVLVRAYKGLRRTCEASFSS